MCSLLAKKIANRIRQSPLDGEYAARDGTIRSAASVSFRDYMALCLYDDEHGYYRSGKVRIGKEGDFYTSSAVGDVMARVLAGYAETYSRELAAHVPIVEWGAGTGRLSAQIAVARRGCYGDEALPARPVLVEDHPGHAAAVQASFAAYNVGVEPLLLRSEQAFAASDSLWERETLVIANELLDAFPVHRVSRRRGKLMELGVSATEGNEFFYTWMELTNSGLAAALRSRGIPLREGQLTELAPEADSWMRRLGSVMQAGRVILIDYGHEAEEYGAEHRMQGTLMAYFRHQAADSPLSRPGEQDITAHVCFTSLRRAAEAAEFQVVYYDTQKQFLVDHGIFHMLSEHDGIDPFGEQARRNRAISQLLLGDAMSETFKVMILQKKAPFHQG